MVRVESRAFDPPAVGAHTRPKGVTLQSCRYFQRCLGADILQHQLKFMLTLYSSSRVVVSA